MAIPVFHSYGHKIDCQVIVTIAEFLGCTMCKMQFEYSLRNKKGYGLTDGEVVERLWAYLRKYSKSTKEMRPSHLIDVLTDALLHYAQRSAQRLGKTNSIIASSSLLSVMCLYT